MPGDAIHVRIGDIVPADARLLDGDPIEVDQSALTGESLPVTRKPGDVVYSGSIVKQGEIDALVYGTGANTYFGKTARAGRNGAYDQPLSTGRAQDRGLPDRHRDRARGR